MYYDRETDIAPENITSNIRVDITMDGIPEENYTPTQFIGNLLLNLPVGITYDLELSHVKITCYDEDVNELMVSAGQLLNPVVDGGYLKTEIIQTSLNVPLSTDSIKLQGRIYLSNNTFFTLNKVLIGSETFINTYFNLTNN